MASDAASGVANLNELFAAWFRETIGPPTSAQSAAWPAIVRGENLLLASPTGSGKTLGAFLPVFEQLCLHPQQGLTCLYVAPLKALCRDAGKNLRRYMRSLRSRIPESTSEIRIGLRTGDTSPMSRARQIKELPHILLTTPETLAVLLSQPRWCDAFRGIRWVIVDEVHALAGNKRGADLALGLERVQALVEKNSGRIQRIGLSATCEPLGDVARSLSGADRPCTIAHLPDRAHLEIIVEPLPMERQGFRNRLGFMARLVDRLLPELSRNRTTLIFANVRSLAERLTWCLRRRMPAWADLIAVHHSSLAVERRRIVERRLKKGKLRVVVTSTSLELGIDIGSVDGVVFVHPPGDVARTIQRIGRSGHKPDQPRRGLFLTSCTAELLESTVTAASCQAGQLERIRLIDGPLDVLCQHLVGMGMTGWRKSSAALALVRRAHPYRHLSEGDFRSCLDYLSGRHGDGRRWLSSRLRWQHDRFAIMDERLARLLRRNLGSIVNEDPRPIRLIVPAADGKKDAGSIPIGSVAEHFADRLRPGDRFVLDGRCFQYRCVEDNVFLVDEAAGSPVVPNWTSGGSRLAPELAHRLFLFRSHAAETMREGTKAFANTLRSEYGLEEAGIAELGRYFLMQESLSEVPGPESLLVETVADHSGYGDQEHYLHTPLARQANDALARVVALRFLRERGWQASVVAADLGLMLTSPQDRPITPEAWRVWLRADGFLDDLKEAVRDSSTLRDRFAQVAMTGMMVLRNPWGGRRKVGGHDWVQRRLFDQVHRADADFVLLRQAEREMFESVCDASGAQEYLQSLPRLEVRCRQLAQPSPFASAWTQPAAVSGGFQEESSDILTNLHKSLLRQPIAV